MSNKNNSNYQGTPPKYLNDFSKALAGEVRILLSEVGKLRDERRQLQYEIAELMSVKSKHGSGGEYEDGWGPARPNQPPPPEAGPPPPEAGPPTPAKPAWRSVHKRPERTGKSKALTKTKGGPPPPAAGPPPPPPKPELPAWAQWRPNPLLSPAPQQATSSAPLPGPPPPVGTGLFGPPTPPPQ